MIVHLVDIGGIVYHHCLSFIFFSFFCLYLVRGFVCISNDNNDNQVTSYIFYIFKNTIRIIHLLNTYILFVFKFNVF